MSEVFFRLNKQKIADLCKLVSQYAEISACIDLHKCINSIAIDPSLLMELEIERYNLGRGIEIFKDTIKQQVDPEGHGMSSNMIADLCKNVDIFGYCNTCLRLIDFCVDLQVYDPTLVNDLAAKRAQCAEKIMEIRNNAIILE